MFSFTTCGNMEEPIKDKWRVYVLYFNVKLIKTSIFDVYILTS